MRSIIKVLAAGVAGLAVAVVAHAGDVRRTTANSGNLVMEDVPPIPADIVDSLNRYQNVRSAAFTGWTEDGTAMYVRTRFGDLSQIHRVARPGGARTQLTFFNEPVNGVMRQPGGSALIFSRDVGGGEFAQIFLMDPATGSAAMLSDGESRNRAVVWDRQGRRIAYQSTRRNGASNDIWIMDPREPDTAAVALEAPDGMYWDPVEFSAGGSQLLALNYASITDARAYLIDLDSGEKVLLAGGGDRPGFNVPLGFDDENDGFWLITDQGGEFARLAWQPLDAAASPEIVTADIPWNVTDVAIGHDRRRAAFTINEGGMSQVYLLDMHTREYRKIDGLPTGRASGLEFSPDDGRLGMTLNTPQAPSDSFSLDLGAGPLDYGKLTRWTTSEVGGLDTSAFVVPELIRFPTFDTVDGAARRIPAWIYRPAGEGPFPVVVSIHGGPESQARPSFNSTYQLWLQKLGVAVVVPNVRGSNGYGKTYVSLDNGFKREDSVRDIGALLDWIDADPGLDGSRVAVIGGSYGGYMVLASAVHYSDRLKAAVDRVGISSFVTFLENTQDYRRDVRRMEYGDEREPEMRAHLEKISPLNNVDKISIPVFVIQGQNDPRVPVTEAQQVVEALRKQGHEVWYMNALNEGHGYRRKENRDIYQQATVMFFEEHLLGE